METYETENWNLKRKCNYRELESKRNGTHNCREMESKKKIGTCNCRELRSKEEIKKKIGKFVYSSSIINLKKRILYLCTSVCCVCVCVVHFYVRWFWVIIFFQQEIANLARYITYQYLKSQRERKS